MNTSISRTLLISVALLATLMCAPLANCSPAPREANRQEPPHPTRVFVAPTDIYGGVAVTVSEPSAFFGLRKLGDRWIFVTPLGNPFWLRAVYSVNPMDGGKEYSEALRTKYAAAGAAGFPWTAFAAQAVRRLRSWGFNALGEYTTEYALPVPTYGRATGNSEPMPFIRFIRPTPDSLTNRWGWAEQPVKDILFGTDRAIYTSYRPRLADVFDPNYALNVIGNAQEKKTANWRGPFTKGLDNIPWMIGTTPDDTDYLGGFRRDTDVHIGWVVAVTAPVQAENPEQKVKYSDTAVHSKQAWRNYLMQKYQTIEALNAAWGSKYTTFDSDGGWPLGRGVLDESGRNPWIGKEYSRLSTAAPAVRADLDAFLEMFAEQYFSTLAGAIRGASPRNLVFGPASLSNARPEIFRAAARHIDVVQVSVDPGRWHELETLAEEMYNRFQKKPMFFWLTLLAQDDSPLAARPVKERWKDMLAVTQEQRGELYANIVNRLFNFRATDGVYPVVGIDWWEYPDKVTRGEFDNFGLVTVRDNAYDGKEAVHESGKDAWGYPTGGEGSDYGDFLTTVTETNRTIDARLMQLATRYADLPDDGRGKPGQPAPDDVSKQPAPASKPALRTRRP